MLNALTNWIKPNALVGQNVNHMARVLIIDDDIDSAKLLGEYLSQHKKNGTKLATGPKHKSQCHRGRFRRTHHHEP